MEVSYPVCKDCKIRMQSTNRIKGTSVTRFRCPKCKRIVKGTIRAVEV